jgi:hypothetical protein
MRIIAINGSPRGREGNTDVLVQAFLAGASDAGADSETVYLSEKRIGHCRGCHSCWFTTPGRCVIDDDMLGVLGCVAGAGLIVLASPVFLANVSGTLKDFVDRLTVTGNPHAAPPQARAGAASASAPPAPPRFVMVSSCGYPGTGQFDVVSLWIHRLAAMMGTRVALEIFTPQGKALRAPTDDQRPRVDGFLTAATAAGRELARGGALSEPERLRLRAGIASA